MRGKRIYRQIKADVGQVFTLTARHFCKSGKRITNMRASIQHDISRPQNNIMQHLLKLWRRRRSKVQINTRRTTSKLVQNGRIDGFRGGVRLDRLADPPAICQPLRRMRGQPMCRHLIRCRWRYRLNLIERGNVKAIFVQMMQAVRRNTFERLCNKILPLLLIG